MFHTFWRPSQEKCITHNSQYCQQLQNRCYCLGSFARQVSSSYDTLSAHRINFRGIAAQVGKHVRFESCWATCSSKGCFGSTLVDFYRIVARKGRPLWLQSSKTDSTFHMPCHRSRTLVCAWDKVSITSESLTAGNHETSLDKASGQIQKLALLGKESRNKRVQ